MSITVGWMRGVPETECEYPKRYGSSRADVVCRRGEAALDSGRLSEAESCFQWLLDICNDPPPSLRCRALAGAGAIARMRGHHARAAALLGQAIAVSSSYHYHDVRARASRDLGLLSAAAGRTDAARDWLEGAAAAYESAVSTERGCCLLELARLYDEIRDWPAMERSCRHALRVLPRRSRRERIFGYLLLSRCLMAQRRREALMAAGRAQWLAWWIRARDLAVEAVLAAADASVMLGDHQQAAGRYFRAYRAARRTGMEQLRARALLGLGRVLLERTGRPMAACTHLRAAAGLFSRLHDNGRLAETLELLVPAARSAGLIHQAEDFQAWLDTLLSDGVRPERPSTCDRVELQQASSI